jgi:hypothetical protein
VIVKSSPLYARWIVVFLLPLAVNGCRGSIPLFIAEHHEHPIRIKEVQVGELKRIDDDIKFTQRDGGLRTDQVGLIKSVVPVYRAVADSDFLRSKATRVRLLVLDERSGTLRFQLKNCEYFSILYARGARPPPDMKLISTGGDSFPIVESGEWAPCHR